MRLVHNFQVLNEHKVHFKREAGTYYTIFMYVWVMNHLYVQNRGQASSATCSTYEPNLTHSSSVALARISPTILLHLSETFFGMDIDVPAPFKKIAGEINDVRA